MGKDKDVKETVVCPVGRFFMDLEKMSGEKTEFFKHLNNSRVEFLKAIRSLVDDRIENLEKQEKKEKKRKMKKIKVE
jgi:sarcosine oxidase delta subunit